MKGSIPVARRASAFACRRRITSLAATGWSSLGGSPWLTYFALLKR